MADGARAGEAGTLESCDARVAVELTEGAGRAIEVEGAMKDVFGPALVAVAERTLDRLGVKGARVKIVDRGALDYVVEARLQVAVERARQGARGEGAR
jgi:citrate lyase subunit gamma (acyl carrier protein)